MTRSNNMSNTLCNLCQTKKNNNLWSISLWAHSGFDYQHCFKRATRGQTETLEARHKSSVFFNNTLMKGKFENIDPEMCWRSSEQQKKDASSSSKLNFMCTVRLIRCFRELISETQNVTEVNSCLSSQHRHRTGGTHLFVCSCFGAVSKRALPSCCRASDWVKVRHCFGQNRFTLTLSVRLAMNDSHCPTGLFWLAT